MHPPPSSHPPATEAERCPFQRAAERARGDGLLEQHLASKQRGEGVADGAPLPHGTVFLVGVNHHTAPVELRERFCQGGELTQMLSDLRRAGIYEAAILFTCNRFEVYAVAGTCDRAAVVAYLAERCGVPAPQLAPSLYHADGADVALHLMRVAAGLESVVLGEPQILGQVADALKYASEAKSIGPLLTRLFTGAVHAGKRARTETGIGRHTLSISHAAVLLLKSACNLPDARVVVLGAGEMGGLAVRALRLHGVGQIDIVNRTETRARTLAATHQARAATMAELAELLHGCDAVIAATKSDVPVIRAAHLAGRDGSRPLQLIDLSVPRNIDAACGELPGVTLHDVDDLEQVVESHRLQRQREATRVEELLDEELSEYLDWMHGRTCAPLVVHLREQAETITNAQIEKALRRLPHLSDEARAIVEQMARRISGGLLHAATVALKARESSGSRSNQPPVEARSGAVGGDVGV